MKSAEGRGRTLDEAVDAALIQLGESRRNVDVKVVSETPQETVVEVAVLSADSATATETAEAAAGAERARAMVEKLLQHMTQEPKLVSPGMQFILATRHLERIADHATNIAEDIIFWVRGLDVRHGRGLAVRSGQSDQPDSPSAGDSAITENSHALHSDVTPACDTERA